MRLAAQLVLLAIVTLMLGADLFAPHSYEFQFREEISVSPSARHPLGTDAVGRDRFSRLLYGGRLSILLAPAAAVVSVAIALLVALAAAVLGSWWERAATTVIDLFLSLPWLFLLLAVRAMLPLNTSPAVSIAVVFALLGLLGWAAPARVLLASTRRHLASDYALLARAGGTSEWHLAIHHVVPNLAPLTKAQFWTTAPAFLLSEANLAILGLGVSEPLPSWGNLLRELQNFAALPHQPWLLVPLLVLIILLSCCQLARPADEFSV
jgi:ABC-type dipeptide/oligopeptide/nickel transport system permease subunit